MICFSALLMPAPRNGVARYLQLAVSRLLVLTRFSFIYRRGAKIFKLKCGLSGLVASDAILFPPGLFTRSFHAKPPHRARHFSAAVTLTRRLSQLISLQHFIRRHSRRLRNAVAILPARTWRIRALRQ